MKIEGLAMGLIGGREMVVDDNRRYRGRRSIFLSPDICKLTINVGEQSPSLQRSLTDIYQVRECRFDRGRSYSTQLFWGAFSHTISYSNVRGMDYNVHMDT